MTERERLLAILNIKIYPHENVDPLEAVADFLLDYGVKVPILCKECKHWHEGTGFCDEHSQFYEHGMYWDIFAEEDFCSYGERKDNGKE